MSQHIPFTQGTCICPRKHNLYRLKSSIYIQSCIKKYVTCIRRSERAAPTNDPFNFEGLPLELQLCVIRQAPPTTLASLFVVNKDLHKKVCVCVRELRQKYTQTILTFPSAGDADRG